MNEMKLLRALGNVENRFVEEMYEADAVEWNKGGKCGKVNRVWIIAAIVAAMVLMMGCATVAAIVIAESNLFDVPLVEPEDVPEDGIYLTASDVTPSSMQIYCKIEGVVPDSNAVFIQVDGPFTLEKQTENGWELLPVLVDDPDWRAREILTDGQTEWWVDWTTVYGVLEPGIYRYTATILEGHATASVEFTVEGAADLSLEEGLAAVLNSEYYFVRYSEWDVFGSMENLPAEDVETIEREYDNLWVFEFWKNGEDLMYISYCDDHPRIGMMYRNGSKYRMDHEGDNNTNPVTGWSLWPGMDVNRLTEWVDMILYDTENLEIEYSEDGRLVSITRRTYWDQYMDSFDMEATTFEVWEFVEIEQEDAIEAFEKQNKDAVLEFSWEEDVQTMKALDFPFVNTSAQSINAPSEAVARAMAECTVEYDKVVVYRDEAAGIWKIEFQIHYGHQGYQFVYLNDEGITQMVCDAGPMVWIPDS